MTYPSAEFLTEMHSRRRMFGVNRLPDLTAMTKAEQEDLPTVVPERVDAQQVYALKLMKRYLNLRYETRPIKRPPSIYLTKLSVTCGYDSRGLTAKLERFAAAIKSDMDAALLANAGPDRRNPSYKPDRINDRWPMSQEDRRTLRDDIEYLLQELANARVSELKDVLAIFADLFGERVKQKTYETFTKRLDQRAGRQPLVFERGTGSIIATGVAAPAVARATSEILGDARLGESSARLVVPAFLGPKTQIAVLKTDHHPDFKKDHLMAAWEAARATSAAPAYLPGHGGDDYVFLDGGVCANNPIMAAVIDTLSAYDVSRDQIEIFSIGTGNAPYAISKFAVRGGFFHWKELIKGAMFLTTDNAQAQATLLLGPERILRLEPKGRAVEIDLDDWASAVQ